ncbi:hypothetical protein [Sphingobium bisphenolivorans]|uniref:hypothetical protein n=1 Tax=Sphingobium bisphenolivorans TaxID=1335760 RepID=UPI0003A92410|nr:hypothetical protein [Sphingobium bisphenolivorans]
MPLTYFADVTTPLLKGGRLDGNYQPEGVHMNPADYHIWADVVRQRLEQVLPAATVRRCTAQ